MRRKHNIEQLGLDFSLSSNKLLKVLPGTINANKEPVFIFLIEETFVVILT